MGAQTLSSRAIIGAYYLALEQNIGAAWVDAVSNMFTSDQESETYPFLGQVPAMREWVGGRQAKGFQENGITIANKHFEATLEVLVRDMRRDKTGQIMARVSELAQRTQSHWAKLLSTLIINGPSTPCYDGQFFFDTDHSEGGSGSQSNDISVDISGLPVSVNGAVTAPSVEEMQYSIVTGIQQIMSIVDNEGEPMNEGASSFLVMVPTTFMKQALSAVSLPSNVGMASQPSLEDFSIKVAVNARLDGTWTDSFAVFRTDGAIKPLIRQQETAVALEAIAEGSELEFKEKLHWYGVDAWRNVGYGMWQGACYVTMI